MNNNSFLLTPVINNLPWLGKEETLLLILEAVTKLFQLDSGEKLLLEGRGDDFKSLIIPIIRQLTKKEDSLDFGLPPKRIVVKSIGKQIALLQSLLKFEPDAESLRFSQEELPRLMEDTILPDWVDGWFAIVNPLNSYQTILSGMIIPTLEREFLRCGWKFTNGCEGLFNNDKFLTLDPRTEAVYRRIGKTQTGNLWFLPVSLANGMIHGGRIHSPKVHLDLCEPGEFGVGLSEGLCALLTHFDERVQLGALRLDFAGSKLPSPRFGSFAVPCLDWWEDRKSKLCDYFWNHFGNKYSPVFGFFPPT
jgi:hypothetical protein